MSKKIKVGVAIPWRPHDSRLRGFFLVLNFYANYFPEYHIYVEDSEFEVWNSSNARNRAVQRAIDDGCNVIIVSDADLIPKKKMLKRAVLKAYKENIVTQPFYRHFRLDEEMSEKYARGVCSKKEIRNNAVLIERTTGGLVVITPKVFKKLNGWDERFKAWGYEDTAFSWAHNCILGKDYFRFDSESYSFYHEDRDMSLIEKNEERLKTVYRPAVLERKKMKNVIKGNRI
jgi:predicted glycosyltransferase involved in capsule biosynthesis